MSIVKQFRTRDELTKEQLKAELSEFVDDGDLIIVIAHRNSENVTDLATSLNFINDRIGLKGLITEAQEIIFRISPPKCYPGDVEI